MMPPSFTVVGFAFLELIAFFGLSIQIIQTVMGASMRPKGQRLTILVAGACAVAHLALFAGMIAMLDWRESPSFAVDIEAEGMLSFLWANLALAGAMAAVAHFDRNRLLWALAALTLLSTPPVVFALGAWWNFAAVIDVGGFLAVGAIQLRRGFERRRVAPTHASIAEAMNVISVGMLVTDGRGGSVFMNDAMRSQLESLQFPTDLGNLTDLWEKAQARVVTLEDLGAGGGVALPSSADENRNQAFVDMGDGRVLAVLIEHLEGAIRGTRVFSVDVTQLIEAARRLSSANAALEEANADLRNRLADVRAIARQAAFLRMRVNVHDVIGQRLSILQRYLDAGKVDEESVARLRSLMDSILNDLRETSGGDPVEHLDDVMDAFSLVGVDVVLHGKLPDEQAVSDALVKIVREACTNACQHAQARTVWVEIGQEEREGGRWATIEVHDDGIPSNAGQGEGDEEGTPICEGTGIPGMRRAVEELGGVFAVRPHPRFAVSASIPLRGNRGRGSAEEHGDGERMLHD